MLSFLGTLYLFHHAACLVEEISWTRSGQSVIGFVFRAGGRRHPWALHMAGQKLVDQSRLVLAGLAFGQEMLFPSLLLLLMQVRFDEHLSVKLVETRIATAGGILLVRRLVLCWLTGWIICNCERFEYRRLFVLASSWLTSKLLSPLM